MHDVPKMGSAVTNFLSFFQGNLPSFASLVAHLIYFLNLNLSGGGGGGIGGGEVGFFLNISKMVKTAFYSIPGIFQHSGIQQYSIRDIHVKLVSISCPSLQILSKTQTGVFPISGFLVNPL